MPRFGRPVLICLIFVLTEAALARINSSAEETQLTEWQIIRDMTEQDLVMSNEQIPQGPVGSNEEKSFAAVERAERIRQLDSSLKIFSPDEKTKINRWADIYQNSTREFYTGRNKMVQSMQARFSRLDSRDAFSSSIDQIVRNETFYSPEFFKGGAELTHITASTSLSPLRGIFGLGAQRINYWPTMNEKAANLNTLRISAMVDPSGTVQAIEVMARDATAASDEDKNAGWEPFVFEKRWGRWFPSNNVKGMPIESFCIRCHVAQDGRFSPYPRNVQDALTFKKIGYLNDIVIQDIMTFK